MPRYRQVDIARYGLKPVLTDLQVPLGAQTLAATIFEGRLGEIVVYFVDCPALYDRDGIYGFGDDDARSVYFNRALLEMLEPLELHARRDPRPRRVRGAGAEPDRAGLRGRRRSARSPPR